MSLFKQTLGETGTRRRKERCLWNIFSMFLYYWLHWLCVYWNFISFAIFATCKCTCTYALCMPVYLNLQSLRKGHFGAGWFVPCREVVLLLEVENVLTPYMESVLCREADPFSEGPLSEVLLYCILSGFFWKWQYHSHSIVSTTVESLYCGHHWDRSQY